MKRASKIITIKRTVFSEQQVTNLSNSLGHLKLLKKITYLFIATIIFGSCSSDDDVNNERLGDYENGVLVTNEGPFGTGTGTISFYNKETNIVENNIYQNVNNKELGNIVQSMFLTGNLAYIVVNNSNRIVIVNRYTFEEVAIIEEGLNNPRYITISGSKGFVTNWGDPFDNNDDFVAVIDLSINEVVSTIPVSFGPEKIIKRIANNEDKIIVLHQGGYDYNNVISVINRDSNILETEIEVGDVPNSFHRTSDSKLLVMCGGKPDFSGEETQGSIFEINLEDNTTLLKEEFNLGVHPSSLVGDTLNDNLIIYLINGDIHYHFGFDTPDSLIEITEGSFYSLTLHTDIFLNLYASDAGDFNSNGEIKVYSPDTLSEIKSFSVGIIPGGVYFND